MANDRLLEGVGILNRSQRRRQCWYQANWSQVRPASLESDGPLPFLGLLEESIQLHWSQTGFFPAQKDVRTSGLGMPLRSLSQMRIALNIFVEENERMCVYLVRVF